jgi:hypothetical protein
MADKRFHQALSVIAFLVLVIIGLVLYDVDLQIRINRLSGDNEDLEDALEESQDDFEFAVAMLEEQIYVTHGILQYGYAFGTLEAIRGKEHVAGGSEPSFHAPAPYNIGDGDPTPPGSVVRYTGRSFNGCPEFEFILPVAVEKGDTIVSVEEMKAMLTEWAEGE